MTCLVYFLVRALVLVQFLHPAICLSFWQARPADASARIRKIPEKCRILILPGFGNASEDYTMDGSLVSSLRARGWSESQVDVLPVERADWLKVFLRGAFDPEFWNANAPPSRPAFKWYLDLIAEKVQALEEDESIILLGHSAGGWLGRAAVGFGSEETEEGFSIDPSKIKGIVTLGAPNQPPPPGIMDMTRGALRITNERFPGAFHAPSAFYITVIGSAVEGKKQERSSPFQRTSVTGFAFQSYEAVCGVGETVGDGVVPVCAAHVDGATQVSFARERRCRFLALSFSLLPFLLTAESRRSFPLN